MIKTRTVLDGVTITTQNRVEGKIRLHLAHEYFDTDKAHLTPGQAREVAADLLACADVIDGFNAGAGGQVLASPQRQLGGAGLSILAMLAFAVLLLVVSMGKAHACDKLTVGAHVATYHFDRSLRYEEFNPGAYVMCDGLTAGAYRNSMDAASAYVGETFEMGPVDITLGVVTGYGKLAPLAVASVELGEGFRLAVFPTYNGNSGGVHLMKDFQ